MSEEIEQVISAKLTAKGALVEDENIVALLESKGYGRKEDSSLLLADYEMLYLAYIAKLEIKEDAKKLDFHYLVERSLKNDANAWTRFLLYRDLRSRGYVPKEGFGFGVDFRVYDRGEHGTKSAKFVIFGLNEGTEVPITALSKSIAQITRMGKTPIIAVVERRGEIIYYKVAKERFQGPT